MQFSVVHYQQTGYIRARQSGTVNFICVLSVLPDAMNTVGLVPSSKIDWDKVYSNQMHCCQPVKNKNKPPHQTNTDINIILN